ncbi:hypothetical protein QJS04_geneDACA015649 [Acorus gramineus]|uniref:Uncharacterized protein n=1 Tax=Acorus gramineus TaxID=55184 RepID=A0AAV9AMH3_ACOGR|nr:hypothetical protein QJS04_geneDACA015649 [Acorus gramineus]
MGRNHSHLSKAWIGINVDEWHRRIAYQRSYDGVAVIVLTTSCCVAVRRLGATRVSCRGFTMSIPGSIRGLMDLLRGLVPVKALHAFACKAGFEQDFLSHFGGKVLRSGSGHDAPFWMGLVQRKLVVGLQRENVPAKLNGPYNVKVNI